MQVSVGHHNFNAGTHLWQNFLKKKLYAYLLINCPAECLSGWGWLRCFFNITTARMKHLTFLVYAHGVSSETPSAKQTSNAILPGESVAMRKYISISYLLTETFQHPTDELEGKELCHRSAPVLKGSKCSPSGQPTGRIKFRQHSIICLNQRRETCDLWDLIDLTCQAILKANTTSEYLLE